MAAHGSSIAALQSSLTTGLSNKADQSAFDVLQGESTPDSVDLQLQHHGGSIASTNNATLATVAANYGLKTVLQGAMADATASYATNAALSASERPRRNPRGARRPAAFRQRRSC